SANLRYRKVSLHRLAHRAWLQEARARWLGELAVQESMLARVSTPGKVASCTGEVARRTCGAGKKVISHGLADPARSQEARARWLGELNLQESKLAWTLQSYKRIARCLREVAMQKSKLARVTRPGKVARGTSEQARQTCGAGMLARTGLQIRQGCESHERVGSAYSSCRKAISHGLADPARLQEALARWLGELATEQCCKRHERGGSAILRCRKVNSHGLADRAMLQEARARWLGELAVQESNLARVSRPGKVARGMSEVARRTCGAENKVISHGLVDPAKLQEARASWLGELKVQESCKRHEGGGSANLGCKKVNSHGLADPATLQEARARWLGELAVQESKLIRVSRPGKVARGTSELARRTCATRKKVSVHGLAHRARLQEARARWLGELTMQESKLARVSKPSKVERGQSELARRTCGAGKPGKVARGTSVVARRTCGAGKYARTGLQIRQGCKRHEGGGSANLRCEKVNSHGLADPARLQEARAWWLGELAVQESKLARVSRLGKVARGTSELARRTCGIRQGCKRQEGGGSANLRCKKVNSPGLEDPERLQEARARWLGEPTVHEIKLARVSRPSNVATGMSEVARQHAVEEIKLTRVSKPSKVERGQSEVARRTCGGGKKVISHGLADPERLQEARARWLGEPAVKEIKLARVNRRRNVASGTSEVARRTCGGRKKTRTGKQTQQGCKRPERGGSANLRWRKVNSHGLADPAKLQEHKRGGSANLRCRKVSMHGLADPTKLQEESKVAPRTCGAGE
ncbi:hypothetical protein CRG98_008257, partial [Punica granatum]